MAAGWDGYAVPLHAEQYVDKTWLVSVQEGRPSAWGSYPPEAKTQDCPQACFDFLFGAWNGSGFNDLYTNGLQMDVTKFTYISEIETGGHIFVEKTAEGNKEDRRGLFMINLMYNGKLLLLIYLMKKGVVPRTAPTLLHEHLKYLKGIFGS